MEKLVDAYLASIFFKAISKSKLRIYFFRIAAWFLTPILRLANLIVYKVDTKTHLQNLNSYFDHLLVNDKKSLASYFSAVIENSDEIKVDSFDKHSNVLFVFHGTQLLQNLGAILYKHKQSLLTNKPLHILIFRRVHMPEFEDWWVKYARFVGMKVEFHHFDSTTYMLKANRILKAGGVLMVAPDYFLGDHSVDEYEEMADSYIKLILRVASRNNSAVNILNTLDPVGSGDLPLIKLIDISDESAAAKEIHREYMNYIYSSWDGWFFSLSHMEAIRKNARPESN